MVDFLFDGPADAGLTLMLGHGGAAPMASPWMSAAATAFAQCGFRVARFDFAYMAARQRGYEAPAPDLEERMAEYRAVVAELAAPGPVLIGGKSMSAGVASLIADGLYMEGAIAGLVCLGFPFHAKGDPLNWYAEHMEMLETPTLIVQGTEDRFGRRDEIDGHRLSGQIEMVWLEGADHDLVVAGADEPMPQASLARAAAEARRWSERLILG